MPPNKYYETAEFQKLAATWEKKLEKSGLENIEQPDGKLKKWSADKFGRRPEWNASKAEYYRAAGKFLYDYKFEAPVDKFVWEMHSNGHSRSEITVALKKARYNKGPKFVRSTVERLSKIMLEGLLK